MQSPMSAAKLLDAEFLGIRCRLIDIAAALDRIDRAPSNAAGVDPRMLQIRRSLDIIASPAANRAEQLQLAFSLQNGQ
ncbi:MAG: hypothetical protein LLG00_12700 [Planctomycetaceae bacterium]|nr:hypothetical protein [Planctomycetaceae bacterium]